MPHRPHRPTVHSPHHHFNPINVLLYGVNIIKLGLKTKTPKLGRPLIGIYRTLSQPYVSVGIATPSLYRAPSIRAPRIPTSPALSVAVLSSRPPPARSVDTLAAAIG